MKRIISLGLAALILLGTLTGVLMSAVYAEEGDNENQGNGGTPNILTSDGILIESYLYKNRTLALTLVDTNVTYQKGNDTFGEFYAALLTGNFYAKDSSTFTEVDWIEAPTGEKNLRFKVEFKNVSFDGNGTEAKFRMYYQYPSDGEENFYEYLVTADLSRYTPTPDDGTTDTPEPDPTVPDPATPYILVQNYSYGGSDVAAGSDFALSINFYNTSADITLENIIMKVEPTTGLSITGASNTYYIPTLDKKGAMAKSIPLKCLTSAVPGSESVHITFSYEYVANDTRQSKSSEETISIPIAQVERFEVELTEIPTMIWPGENTNVVLSYVNKGRADIYNLTAKIEGNIDDPNQVQNLGNIKAGDSGTVKFSVSSMEAGGMVSAVITVTYENEKGDVSTITKDFTCEVYDNSGELIDPGLDPGLDPGFEEPVEEDTGMRWWQWAMFGIGCLAVGGVSGAWMFLKTKLKREEADDEDI